MLATFGLRFEPFVIRVGTYPTIKCLICKTKRFKLRSFFLFCRSQLPYQFHTLFLLLGYFPGKSFCFLARLFFSCHLFLQPGSFGCAQLIGLVT
jgi:hypothetical protein